MPPDLKEESRAKPPPERELPTASLPTPADVSPTAMTEGKSPIANRTRCRYLYAVVDRAVGAQNGREPKRAGPNIGLSLNSRCSMSRVSRRNLLAVLPSSSPVSEALEPRRLFTVTFGPPVISPVGASTVFAVGDFAGGKDPGVVVKQANGDLHYFAGTGKGTFAASSTTAGSSIYAGANVVAIVSADLNHDGKLDLIVLNAPKVSSTGVTTPGSVAVLLGNGNGTFAAPVYYAAGPDPVALAVTDVNGDGWPDVITANDASWPGSVGAAGNAGTEFGAGLLIGSATGLKAVTRISLPAVETAVASAPATTSVTPSSASPTMALAFAEPSTVMGSSGVETEVTLVATASSASASPSIISSFYLPGTNHGLAAGTFTAGTRPGVAAAQVVAASGTTPASVRVYTVAPQTSSAAGASAPYIVSAPFPTGLSTVTAIAAGDLNHDGISDIAVAGTYVRPSVSATTLGIVQSGVSVLLGTTSGSFGTPSLFSTKLVPSALALSDVNADGSLDIVTSDTTGLETLLNITPTALGGGSGSTTVLK